MGSLNVKRREKPAQYHTNRLSAVSTESGKNSSESVDILTCSTECTTSPESELLSVGQSVSHSSSAFGKTYLIIRNYFIIDTLFKSRFETDFRIIGNLR